MITHANIKVDHRPLTNSVYSHTPGMYTAYVDVQGVCTYSEDGWERVQAVQRLAKHQAECKVWDALYGDVRNEIRELIVWVHDNLRLADPRSFNESIQAKAMEFTERTDKLMAMLDYPKRPDISDLIKEPKDS